MKKEIALVLALALAVSAPAWPAKKLETAKVKRGPIADVLKFRGRIISTKKVPIFSEATGQIVKLHVDQGKTVQKGDLLLEIDKTQLVNSIDKQKIALEKSEIAFKNAQTDFKRKQALYDEKFIAEIEYDSAKKAMDLAKLDLSMARKDLDALTQQLDKVNVASPISGIVTKKNVEEGEVVGSMSAGVQSKLLLEITDVSQKRVEAYLSEADRALLSTGQEVTFWLETDPDRRHAGRIVKIDDSPQPVDKQNQFRSEIEILDEKKDFTLGVNVTVEAKVAEASDALIVPVEAVFREDSGPVVFVKKLGRHEKRAVQTGIGSVQSIQIKKGLKEGEEVFLEDPAR